MRKTSLIRWAALAAAVVVQVTVSSSSALSAEDCLAGPNSPSPAGSHWYYRLELPSQRKCWYLGAAGREVHEASPKVRVAAKASAVAKMATAGAKAKVASQTVLGDETHNTSSSVSRKAAPTPVTSVADEQASRQIELPPMPPAPMSSDPEPAASAEQKSGPAAAFSGVDEDVSNAPVVQVNSIADAPQHETAVREATQVHDPDRKDDAKSATFSPVRAFLLIPAALAFSGLFAFAVLPSGLRRQIYARRRGSEGGTTAQAEMPARFIDTVAEPRLPDQEIEIPEELKRNLQQVLQTLESQVHENGA